jgi:DNA repair exonuclease SbcCD nuclease subunit
MPLTFIHTSDWHLGRRFRRIGPKSLESTAWRYEAVRNLYEVAAREQAAFILVAGDLFQTDTPAAKVLEETVALLRDSPVLSIVIPGNHDPLTEGSVWNKEEFAGRLAGLPNVHLALTCEPIELPQARTIIFPCPATSKSCPEDLSAWIPPASRGGECYRIGLAHGIWQGYDGGQYFKNFIAAQRAESSGLDYLALGDLHSYTLADHPAARVRSYYSGTPECTAVDEERPSHVLLVNISRPGEEPSVKPVRVGRVRPVKLSVAVTPGNGLGAIQARIATINNPADVLLSLKVSGTLAPQELEEFDLWINKILPDFMGIELERQYLYREPSDADFEGLGLDAAQRQVLHLLKDPDQAKQLRAAEAQEMFIPLATDSAVRREALSLYYSYLRQASRGALAHLE